MLVLVVMLSLVGLRGRLENHEFLYEYLVGDYPPRMRGYSHNVWSEGRAGDLSWKMVPSLVPVL
jgi:hypothetical protein